jgi:sec-independent protein translocase protein TatA
MILPLAFIEGIGGPELLMIMFIILLLFGANRLPDLARGLGKSVREFKKATSGIEDQIREAMEDKPEPTPESQRFAPKPVVVPPQNTQPAAPSAPPPASGNPPPSGP